jgi:nitroreductase
MDFDTVLRSRRAVRQYAPEAVSEPQLRQLIDAAIQAPSAMDEQPWIFSVVRGKAALARMSDMAKAHFLAHPPQGAPPELLQRLADARFDIFYDAPALIVISSATQGPWAVANCALAAENLMLAARATGFGSCWIGLAQPWLETAEGKAAIEAPSACLPVAPIIVGRPESQPAPVARREPDIVWVG